MANNNLSMTSKASEVVLSLGVHHRYFLSRGNADMRKSFDGLSGIIRDGLNKDPLGGDVFVFLNRSCHQIKLLCWEGDGFYIVL
jgi:transposase